VGPLQEVVAAAHKEYDIEFEAKSRTTRMVPASFEFEKAVIGTREEAHSNAMEQWSSALAAWKECKCYGTLRASSFIGFHKTSFFQMYFDQNGMFSIVRDFELIYRSVQTVPQHLFPLFPQRT